MTLGSNFPCADTSSRIFLGDDASPYSFACAEELSLWTESAVRDGNIIKARMPSVLLKFCLLVIEALS